MPRVACEAPEEIYCGDDRPIDRISNTERLNEVVLFLYSVGSCQWVLEDVQLGGHKGKEHENKEDCHKCQKSRPLRSADKLFGFEKPRFIDEGYRGRKEEDHDIEPIGRLRDRAVVGVEENGDQYYAEQNSTQLHAPEVLAMFEEEALQDGKQKAWHKQKLHMLPG